MSLKENIRSLVGYLPFSAELYRLWKKDKLHYYFRLTDLEEHLPELIGQVTPFAEKAGRGRNVFIFGSTHYWIEQDVQMGMALAGLGHQVTLGYIPNSYWKKAITRLDLRVQNLHAGEVLAKTRPWLTPVSLLDIRPKRKLPAGLQQLVDKVTLVDTQYVLQNEDVSRDSRVYALRKRYNDLAARAAYAYFQSHRPDVVIIPNGMIFEFGAVYEVARYLGLDTETIEFSDAASSIWIARNIPVVRHDTDDLWEARRDIPLSGEQRQWLVRFFERRQKPESDKDFVWLSQPGDVRGGKQARLTLGLDGRPVVLLATNVLGDSLTLGRQVFSPTMIEWLKRTIKYFVGHPEVQLVIRIHPGESIMVGPASAGHVIQQTFPNLPEHIHVVGANEPINTYDLLDITDLGLVYVTTAGLEMAARGIPVMVGGLTHYRGRGFTIDPTSWEDYFSLLDGTLPKLPRYRLTAEQLELAWSYAYRFFRDFPRPYPWHLSRRWKDFEERPLSYVLGEGLSEYGSTFRYLAGDPIDWKKIDPAKASPAGETGTDGSIDGNFLQKQQQEQEL